MRDMFQLRRLTESLSAIHDQLIANLALAK